MVSGYKFVLKSVKSLSKRRNVLDFFNFGFLKAYRAYLDASPPQNT